MIPATITLSGNGRVIRLLPAAPLAPSTAHSIQLTSGLRDLQGTSFGGQTLFNFTTGTTADTAPPTVTSVTPPNGAASVGVNGLVKVQFSEPVNPITVSGTSVRVSGGTVTLVPMSLSFDTTNTQVTFTPPGDAGRDGDDRRHQRRGRSFRERGGARDVAVHHEDGRRPDAPQIRAPTCSAARPVCRSTPRSPSIQ